MGRNSVGVLMELTGGSGAGGTGTVECSSVGTAWKINKEIDVHWGNVSADGIRSWGGQRTGRQQIVQSDSLHMSSLAGVIGICFHLLFEARGQAT